jgi:hypothetical protein
VKKSHYHGLQLDESVDVANLAILLGFVRCSNKDTDTVKELLFCHPLEKVYSISEMPTLLKTKEMVTLYMNMHRWGHINDK